MKQGIGQLVFEKTSWGKKQIKAEFGLDIIKSNISSLDLASLLYKHLAEQVGFKASEQVIDQVITHASSVDSTYGYKGYMNMLSSIWTEFALPLQVNGAESEFTYIKRFFNKMKAECPEGTVIGKNQVKTLCLKHALDLLYYV